MSTPAFKRRRKQVFSSVFPTSSTVCSAPTPLATPVVGFSTPSQSFSGLSPTQSPLERAQPSSVADERIAWNRAWHTATALLSLPRRPIDTDADWIDPGGPAQICRDPSPAEARALDHVLSRYSSRHGVSSELNEHDLVEWYSNEVRGDFLAFTKPMLATVSPPLLGVLTLTMKLTVEKVDRVHRQR